LHTLLGHELFTAGAKLYFERHDGQAVTCDEFVSAMEQVSDRDLTQFRRWYEQSGTPELVIEDQYDPMAKQVTLTVTQNNGSGPDGSRKPPLHLPLAIGLVVNGQSHTFEEGSSTRLLEVREVSQTFQINNVQDKPAASLLRGFSAPVRLRSADDDDTLAALISNDRDEFVKWDAMQRYSSRVIEAQMRGDPVSDAFVSAYRKAMSSDTDDAMKALLLLLPSEESLADRQAQQGSVDVFQIREAREHVRKILAIEFEGQWTDWFNSYAISEAYQPNGWQIGKRALRHLSLDYLGYGQPEALEWAEAMLCSADNLSDRLAALRVLVNADNESVRSAALEDFYQKWQHEALIINQWFTLQAIRPSPDTVEAVLQLQNHGAFDWRNPNKIRALVGAFASANPTAFHRQDGGGYALLGDAIARVQSANPQIAARLCTPLTRFRRYAHGVDAMQQQLERIASLDDLSRDVYEVVSKALEK
jgi:aminopeptidase N